jgi:outer membrane protein TolC
VADPVLRARQQQLAYRYVVSAFVNVLIKARNERLEKLRNTWPDLAKLRVNNVDLLKADVDEAQAAVVQAAITNRLDLMNVRAQVVDAWRQLAVFANALLGTFNVQYHLDSSTPAGLAQPLAFSASRTHHELFLNTVLPIVRTPERNNYRASLINYERARRILQRAEDQVAFDTRNEIRSLRQLEENYRIQQRQVELGYLTVENSLDTFQAPSAPGTASSAATAFSLTNQLITAQQSLYTAQFAMTTIWINYLNTRLQLYRDMELMPLDYRGVWIDEFATNESSDGSGNCAGQRGTSGTTPRAGLEWLPDSDPVPPEKGTRVVRPQ